MCDFTPGTTDNNPIDITYNYPDLSPYWSEDCDTIDYDTYECLTCVAAKPNLYLGVCYPACASGTTFTDGLCLETCTDS